MTEHEHCLGFDENGNLFSCPNKPGTPWTPFWCGECDERRRHQISDQLVALETTLREET